MEDIKALIEELYVTCESIMEHKLHDVEKSLLLHHSKEDFRIDIGLAKKSGLNTLGSELIIYDSLEGQKLHNAYRLLLKGEHYIVCEDMITQYPSKAQPTNDKIKQLLNKAKDKEEVFNSKLRELDAKAKVERITENSIADVIDDYGNTWIKWSEYIKNNKHSMPKLYKESQRRDYCFQLLDCRLGIIEDEKLEKKLNILTESVDLSILILIILGILPEYGKSPRNYDEAKESEYFIHFIEEYFESRFIGNTYYYKLLRFLLNELKITKFLIIELLRIAIKHLTIIFTIKKIVENSDKIAENIKNFYSRYDIEGVWEDEKGTYWSLSKQDFFYFAYKFVSIREGCIEYQKYMLYFHYEEDEEGPISIIDFSSRMDAIRSKSDMKWHLAEYKLTSHKRNKRDQQIIEIININSLLNETFKSKKFKRVNEDSSKNLIKMWNTYDHKFKADMFYCSYMQLNTISYIYLGSEEKNDEGKHKFFYKVDKFKLMEEDGLSVSFDWNVCLVKAIWHEPYCEKLYVLMEKTDRHYDVEDYLGVYITKTDEEETKIIQQIIDMEGKRIIDLIEGLVEMSNNPFHDSDN